MGGCSAVVVAVEERSNTNKNVILLLLEYRCNTGYIILLLSRMTSRGIYMIYHIWTYGSNRFPAPGGGLPVTP